MPARSAARRCRDRMPPPATPAGRRQGARRTCGSGEATPDYSPPGRTGRIIRSLYETQFSRLMVRQLNSRARGRDSGWRRGGASQHGRQMRGGTAEPHGRTGRDIAARQSRPRCGDPCRASAAAPSRGDRRDARRVRLPRARTPSGVLWPPGEPGRHRATPFSPTRLLRPPALSHMRRARHRERPR